MKSAGESVDANGPESRGPRRRRRRATIVSTSDLIKPSRLDSTDREILSVLAQNSRWSAREIARRLGMSVGLVLDRIQRLEEDNVIFGYRVEVDPEAVGYAMTVTVGVELDGKSTVEETMNALIAIPEVQVVHWVTSTFDLIVTLCVDDMARFQHIVLEKLRFIPGFVRSDSMISLFHWRRVGGQFAFIWPSPEGTGKGPPRMDGAARGKAPSKQADRQRKDAAGRRSIKSSRGRA